LDQKVIFTTDAYPEKKMEANISQIRYSPVEDQNVITYQVIASFKNPNEILFPGMTANIDIIIDERKDTLKIKNSALSVKLQGEPAKDKNSKWGGSSNGQSQMRDIMSKIILSKEQQGKMRNIYPQLGKKKNELSSKGMSEEKVSKQVSQFFETLFIELLSDDQKSQFFNLKKSSEIKKIYKLVEGKIQELKISTGLKAGGYTEILNGEVKVGDEIISKILINESPKKALRLF
jgi:HlyD family secretion protein